MLLRYDGGRPRQSQRIGGLPCPAGRTGGGRVVLVRTDVVTKRSARARYSPWLELGGRGERTVRTASTWRGARGGDWQRVSRPPCCTVTRCDCTCTNTRASYAVRQSFVFCTLTPQGLSSLISTRFPLGLGSLNVGGDGPTLLYGFVLPDTGGEGKPVPSARGLIVASGPCVCVYGFAYLIATSRSGA